VSDILRVTDWTSVGNSLIATGSAYVRGAVDRELVQHLINIDRPPWHALPPEEGVVRQHGFVSHISVAAADPIVVSVGVAIVQELTKATASLGLPAIPEFNEASWTRYPERTGHITAHRDPFAYGGIIAVATLFGQATFRVWSGADLGTPQEVLASGAIPTPWETAAGDLVLLRGNGWPTPNVRCPTHEVDTPPNSERMIMTLRYNTRGAGGGYDV
jgi:hypothetical protein